jgi:hypothetical protein
VSFSGSISDEYRRVRIEVRTDDGTVEAFAYEYNRSLAGRPPVGTEWIAR